MSPSAKPTGFKTLRDEPSAELDIVFVHGLQGYWEKTWTYHAQESQTETLGKNPRWSPARRLLGRGESKKNKENMKYSASTPKTVSTDLFWPKNLLCQEPSCNKARVMMYGYDSKVWQGSDGVNSSTITDHGENLLNGIASLRTSDMNRPLMFITHSLGGLIVKSVCYSGLSKDLIEAPG